ncbi:5527_t:CDS:2 [Diversispora eburnea]|uniref:Long-chain-alcohol oxidase n=1 Tax=Diversispora eburnea TaxID=1213867 RepID=A0A9N9AU06_9GLOM|nr:5527_t:CDS:2 [Diversispora eburnea]
MEAEPWKLNDHFIKLIKLPMETEPWKLNDHQIKVLKAFCGTFIAELTDDEIESLLNTKTKIPIDSEKIREFGKFDLSKQDEFIELLIDHLKRDLSMRSLSRLSKILTLFTIRPLSFLLTGHLSLFYELSRKDREIVLQKWSKSFSFYRDLYKTFSSIILISFWSSENASIFNSTIGYPGPDPRINSQRYTENLSKFPIYDFIQVPPEGLELQFDVVVIGSGAGGGVAAAQLAKAGYKVLVIEKGKYYHQSELTLTQADSTAKLYEQGGTIANQDNTIGILAGSTFGGGTTVNFSASFKLPNIIREEWASEGLDHFTTKEYDNSQDAVEERMGVSTKAIVHDEKSNILIEGCKRLNYHYADVPQNTAGAEHQDGWCLFGCRYGEKQGSLITWLRDARDNGAKFVQDCYVKKVLIKDKKAVGVEATVGSDKRKLIVHSKKVIVSCGSVHSPALLKRSGLRNKNVGKNLFLHPGMCITGTFPDKEIKSYYGTIISAYSSIHTDIYAKTSGHDYGTKIELMPFHPSYEVASIPWKSGLNHKQRMLQLNHHSPLLIIGRDKYPGSIDIDDNGEPRVHYTVNDYDLKNITEGVVAAVNVLVVTGAKSIDVGISELDEFVPTENDPLQDPKLKSFIENIRKIGTKNCNFGIVNPRGKTWEVDNLYVADASVFPSAPGVNPMITICSVAYSIANFIIEDDQRT